MPTAAQGRAASRALRHSTTPRQVRPTLSSIRSGRPGSSVEVRGSGGSYHTSSGVLTPSQTLQRPEMSASARSSFKRAARGNKRAALKRIATIERMFPGLADAAPKVRLNRDLSGERALEGFTPAGQYISEPNKIKLDSATSRSLGGKWGPERIPRDTGTELFIHELIHANQRPGLPHWLEEGGAELLARKLNRGTFGFENNVGGAYQDYIRKVKARGGARLVRKTLR